MAANSGGKRAGARRGARPKMRFRPSVLAYAVAITALAIGWGYLVWAAIDFGVDARGGDSDAWRFLGLAAVGAAACLFAGLMLVARLLRALGGNAPAGTRTDTTAVALPQPLAPLDATFGTSAGPPVRTGNGTTTTGTTTTGTTTTGATTNGTRRAAAPAATDGARDASSVVGPGGLPTRSHVREVRDSRKQRPPGPPGGSHRHRAG